MTDQNTSVERDPALRCDSTSVEVPGRTHMCRLAKHDDGEHLCICSRKWDA